MRDKTATQDPIGTPWRLRAWAKDIREGRNYFGADQDLIAAADEIERLRERVAKLEAELDGVYHGMEADERG